jgi:protein-tyrosine-phosphatase
MEEAKPASVLFVCTMNAVRSPMAAGLLRRLKGREIYVESAGVFAGELDPLAAHVMAEIGIPLSEHRPKRCEDFGKIPFDLVVALSAEAENHAKAMGNGGRIEVWRTPDPTQEEGSEEQRKAAYRAVRDGLRRKIAAYFA